MGQVVKIFGLVFRSNRIGYLGIAVEYDILGSEKFVLGFNLNHSSPWRILSQPWIGVGTCFSHWTHVQKWKAWVDKWHFIYLFHHHFKDPMEKFNLNFHSFLALQIRPPLLLIRLSIICIFNLEWIFIWWRNFISNLFLNFLV